MSKVIKDNMIVSYLGYADISIWGEYKIQEQRVTSG